MTAQLGDSVKDRVTGFSGVVYGVVDYLSGCTQALIVPAVKKDGTLQSSEWFDIQRLEVLKKKRIELDNGSTPGCGPEAPKR